MISKNERLKRDGEIQFSFIGNEVFMNDLLFKNKLSLFSNMTKLLCRNMTTTLFHLLLHCLRTHV